VVSRATFWLVAPYAAWMALMTALPATAACYAIRTVVVAAMLMVGWRRLKVMDFTGCHELGNLANREGDASDARVARDARPVSKAFDNSIIRLFDHSIIRPFDHSIIRLFLYSIIGLFVFLVWILPEQFDWAWYRQWCIVGEGGTKAVAEASAAMVAMRLVGSAFVISVAEELFFRKWLVGFAGFGWMVALFAIEHDRWLVGAIAGAVYGLLCLRRGLLAAIVAHATTNLVLGLWVLRTGQWQFW
jgi:hypothetical protein